MDNTIKNPRWFIYGSHDAETVEKKDTFKYKYDFTKKVKHYRN